MSITPITIDDHEYVYYVHELDILTTNITKTVKSNTKIIDNSICMINSISISTQYSWKNITSLIIYVNNCDIITIPINLLKLLCRYDIIDDKKIIYLTSDIFLKLNKHFYTYLLRYSAFSYCIKANIDMPIDIEFAVCERFYHDSMILNTEIAQVIKTYHTIIFNNAHYVETFGSIIFYDGVYIFTDKKLLSLKINKMIERDNQPYTEHEFLIYDFTHLDQCELLNTKKTHNIVINKLSKKYNISNNILYGIENYIDNKYIYYIPNKCDCVSKLTLLKYIDAVKFVFDKSISGSLIISTNNIMAYESGYGGLRYCC